MKKIIRLTESDLTRLVKRVVKEQNSLTSKESCPKKKSAAEVLAKVREEGADNYFFCFDIPEAFRQRMTAEEGGGMFAYNSQANVLEIYKVKGPYLFFGGPYKGEKLGNIKMSKDFPSKIPRINEADGDFPFWEIKEGKVCLSIGGFC
jgi:hypothetical protein